MVNIYHLPIYSREGKLDSKFNGIILKYEGQNMKKLMLALSMAAVPAFVGAMEQKDEFPSIRLRFMPKIQEVGTYTNYMPEKAMYIGQIHCGFDLKAMHSESGNRYGGMMVVQTFHHDMQYLKEQAEACIQQIPLARQLDLEYMDSFGTIDASDFDYVDIRKGSGKEYENLADNSSIDIRKDGKRIALSFNAKEPLKGNVVAKILTDAKTCLTQKDAPTDYCDGRVKNVRGDCVATLQAFLNEEK